METQRSEQWTVPLSEAVFMFVFGVCDAHMYINTTDPHKFLQNTLLQRGYVIKHSLYINTWFVCASVINTDTREPSVWLLYITVIVFTLITIVIHQTLTSATLACFIQPRAVVCVSYAHAVVRCFVPLFSLYFTQSDEKWLELLRNINITECVQERWC